MVAGLKRKWGLCIPYTAATNYKPEETKKMNGVIFKSLIELTCGSSYFEFWSLYYPTIVDKVTNYASKIKEKSDPFAL